MNRFGAVGESHLHVAAGGEHACELRADEVMGDAVGTRSRRTFELAVRIDRVSEQNNVARRGHIAAIHNAGPADEKGALRRLSQSGCPRKSCHYWRRVES